MILLTFYFFSLLTLLPAIYLLFTRQLIEAGVALLLTFVGVAGLYVLAGADFLAATQLLVYAGGILILLLFGIMMTQKPRQQMAFRNWGGWLLAAAFLGLIVLLLQAAFSQQLPGTSIPPLERGSTLTLIGTSLLTDNLLPFELAGILLLVALVGAGAIAGKEKS
jgi:NADH:ubiquinone oxidoreductase subunit 6 (subunit J)